MKIARESKRELERARESERELGSGREEIGRGREQIWSYLDNLIIDKQTD